jgi:N6-adenosine-specific RNA methylase IME4
MPTEEICNMAVQPLCAPDCILFLWATYPMLPEAFKVIAAWGFAFKTVGFTWVKQSPSGRGFTFGLGYWTRANPEICLIATKGSPKRKRFDIPNLLLSPRREHSRKPDEARERIVALCGDLPRLELFARERPKGWKVWGNEVKCDVEIGSNDGERLRA